MKTKLTASWFLPLLILGLVSAPTWGADPPKDPAGKAPVYGVRTLTLKANVKPEQFEKFLKEEFNPVFKTPLGGMRMLVLKADRGESKGTYLFVWEFASVEVRAKYYPEADKTPPEEAQKAIEEALKPAMEVYEKLLTKYVDISGTYTDYVLVM